MKLEKQSKGGAWASLVAILFVLSGFLTVESWAAQQPEIVIDTTNTFASSDAVYLQWNIENLEESAVRRYFVGIDERPASPERSVPADKYSFIFWNQTPGTEKKYQVSAELKEKVNGKHRIIGPASYAVKTEPVERKRKLLDPERRYQLQKFVHPKHSRGTHVENSLQN